MEDLYALDKQGSYMELISHMNDIGPTNRNEAWQTLVQHTVAKTAEQLSAAGDFYAAVELAEQVGMIRNIVDFKAPNLDDFIRAAMIEKL